MTRVEDFWSRRKARVREEEADLARAAETRRAEAREREAAERPDDEILRDLGLPDPDAMQPGDDFSAFMVRAVPERIRRRALRRLWRSNAALANLDGLLEYGEDYTDRATVIAGLKTAYQVGRGMVARLPDPARDADDGTRGDADDPVGVTARDVGKRPVREDVETAGRPTPKAAGAVPLDTDSAAAQPARDDDAAASPSRRRMRFEFPGGGARTPSADRPPDAPLMPAGGRT